MVPHRNAGRTCLWDRAGLVSVEPNGWGRARQRQGRETQPGQAEPRPELRRLRVHPRQKTLSGKASGILSKTLMKKAN